ncbi:hypothetical protein Tco_1440458 [Tanacetum coccineum]
MFSLSLSPFYQAFLISASVPAIYMHELWAIVSYQKHYIKFKMNKKNYSFDLETFRYMLQICPNLPSQKFEDPQFEEDIFAFIRELGYPGDIKSLSDVRVGTLYQPWRTFRTIINKCLSGQITGLDQFRLSRAQIIWVISNHFMSKNQSIPRRNKVDWHMAKDDPTLTTMRFIPKHETVQKYGAIIPDTLTNQAKKESDAYNTYHDFATGKVIPKSKYVRKSTREKTDQAPTASPGKRLKAIAKAAKSGKKKLPTQGLETLSEITLSEAEQMKIVTKRSKTQFQRFHASGSGANEGTGVSQGVPDVPTYGSEDEQICWMSSDKDNDDETKSNNDGDDFVHPKFSIHDEEERQDEEDKEEDGSDLRVQTPSHFESTDDEAYDEVTQGDNVEGEELDEEEKNEEEEVNELYRDVNVNLERRDTEMIDALQTNQRSSVSSGFISNMLNPNPDTSIDSILNLNTESTSLVDVPVTTNVEMPPSFVTTLPPPPIPLIQPLQQIPVPSPTIDPSTSLQNLPTFGSLFKFEDRVKALEDDFLEFKQTNLYAEAVSLIPGIVDKYLANQMNKAIKAVVQL